MRIRSIFLSLLMIAIFLAGASKADHLTLLINGKTVELDGEILIEAKDRSLYFREVDGKIWFVEPGQIQNKIEHDSPAKAISKELVGQRLLKELPKGFRIYETRHYVIAYQNEIAFARWIGGLYESRLYRAFEKFWVRKNKFKLTDPEFPLIAIVFGSRAQYQQYVDRELGPGQSMIAYYNLQTNRITMYDLTADQRNPNQPLNDRRIDQVLQNPAAITMVATIIHEATHQLIFNRGVQTRFAEAPLWLNEGLAMFFEAPELRSKAGWQAPGKIFERRLVRLRQYGANRPADSLKTLIMSDDRLRDPDRSVDAYAEAWALNHFLLNRHAEKFVEYIKHISTKKVLHEDSSETRLADFHKYLGVDLEELDQEFMDYVRRLR